MIVKVPWHKFCRTKKLFSLGLRLVNKTRSRLDDSNETWTKVSFPLSRYKSKNAGLPFHKAYHQYCQREIQLWHVLSSFGCIGYVAPKPLPNWGKVDPLTPETWNYFLSGVGKTIGRGLSRCEHGFFPYGKILQKRRRNSIQYNITKEMETEMDKRGHTKKLLHKMMDEKCIRKIFHFGDKNFKMILRGFLSMNEIQSSRVEEFHT